MNEADVSRSSADLLRNCSIDKKCDLSGAQFHMTRLNTSLVRGLFLQCALHESNKCDSLMFHFASSNSLA